MAPGEVIGPHGTFYFAHGERLDQHKEFKRLPLGDRILLGIDLCLVGTTEGFLFSRPGVNIVEVKPDNIIMETTRPDSEIVRIEPSDKGLTVRLPEGTVIRPITNRDFIEITENAHRR